MRFSTVVAMLVAPLLAAATVAVFGWLAFGGGDFGGAVAIFTVAAAVALPVTIVLGPFVFVYLQKRQWRQWHHYVLAGAVCAALVSAAYTLALVIADGAPPEAAVFIALWAVPVGMLTALVGWAIRRPDRDKPRV